MDKSPVGYYNSVNLVVCLHVAKIIFYLFIIRFKIVKNYNQNS